MFNNGDGTRDDSTRRNKGRSPELSIRVGFASLAMYLAWAGRRAGTQARSLKGEPESRP